MQERAWPSRVDRPEEAVRRFGDLTERMVRYLEHRDPLADEAARALSSLPHAERHGWVEAALAGRLDGAPPALALLVETASVVPPWVDWQRVDTAEGIFLRAGVLGGATLGLCSLVHGYSAPAGNKPLAFSGRLTEQADRRLAETGKFVTAVTAPGGLRPGALGFRICLHVRLMHAEVRRLVLSSGRWDQEAWSQPINQHDMLATILLFSSVFIEGIRHLGVHVSEREADDYQHTFRWVGTLMGVEADLLPATFDEAVRLSDFIRATQGAPDADSVALVRALLDGPLRLAKTPAERRRAEVQVAVATGLCRSLIGDALADSLGLTKDRHRHWALAVRGTLKLLESARRGVPQLNEFVRAMGSRYWDASLTRGLGDRPARFEMPERLGTSGPR